MMRIMKAAIALVGAALVVGVLLMTLIWPAAARAQAGNWGGTIFSSLARTATATSVDIANASNRGVQVVVVISAFTSGTWTPTIQGKDPASGTYYTLLTGAALAGTGTTVLTLYPGVTPVANVAVSNVLPKTWRVVMTGASTPVATFSVGYLSVQ